MCEVELNTRVYVKMMLHAARYPHSTVSGVLLGHHTPSCLTLIDCVPVCHLQLPLSLSLEVALAQIDSWSALQGLVIAGFYQASAGLRDTSISLYFNIQTAQSSLESAQICTKDTSKSINCAALKAASLISEYQEEAVLILMDNERLSSNPGIPPLTVLHQNSSKQWVPKEKTLVMWGHWEETQRITRQLLHAKAYHRLTDFDNHLDDIRADWTNQALNVEIARLSAAVNGSM